MVSLVNTSVFFSCLQYHKKKGPPNICQKCSTNNKNTRNHKLKNTRPISINLKELLEIQFRKVHTNEFNNNDLKKMNNLNFLPLTAPLIVLCLNNAIWRWVSGIVTVFVEVSLQSFCFPVIVSFICNEYIIWILHSRWAGNHTEILPSRKPVFPIRALIKTLLPVFWLSSRASFNMLSISLEFSLFSR